MFSFTERKKYIRWHTVLATFFVCAVAIIALVEWRYTQRWRNAILPGVHIGVIDVGGETLEYAREKLEPIIESITRNGFIFTYEGKRVVMSPILSASADPDLTYELLRWDLDATLTNAENAGRQGPWWRTWYRQTRIRWYGQTIEPVYTLEKDRLKNALQENFHALEMPAMDAHITVHDHRITIVPEVSGKIFNYTKAIEMLAEQLNTLSLDSIPLPTATDYPRTTTKMVQQLVPQMEVLREQGPLILTTSNRTWRIAPDIWGTWFTVTTKQGTPTLAFNEAMIAGTLAPIAKEIDTPTREAKFIVRNGRVVEFQSAQKGQQLNSEKTIERIQRDIIDDHANTIALVITEQEPITTNAAANDFGIIELIGVGRSNFKGSPTNRRHNIATGARALNGVLVAPDEEFSLIKTLGTIDHDAGYKEELVIKGDRTIPEFGGGLCQIGTTTFRATLDSGLPILERRNHSYSVPYYLENGKPGVDATIYGPKPDFRFFNDTGNHLLIQTKIKGDDLIFEFWGKKDGRIATRSEPKVWNIKTPPPTKIVETEDLPVGEKKCTERAHTGATAEFTYTVAMPDGEKREQVFRSVYRPWQEVCLVGKEKSVTPKPDTTQTPELPSADTEGVRGE